MGSRRGAGISRCRLHSHWRPAWLFGASALLLLLGARWPEPAPPPRGSPSDEDPQALRQSLREARKETPRPRRRRGPPPCATPGVVCRGSAPMVALTFDDCFLPDLVEPLLQDLEAVGARATFFCVGRVFRSHPELARRLVAGGHELGNHTLHHRMLAPRPDRRVIDAEIDGWQRAVEEALGGPYPTRWFRPPGMAGFTTEADPKILEAVRRRGMRVALWTLDVYRLWTDWGCGIRRRWRPFCGSGCGVGRSSCCTLAHRTWREPVGCCRSWRPASGW
jgi:Predicted xylanase/chitin deacetylase